MLNIFRKLIWYVSSKTPTFRRKEGFVRLISRPNSLGTVTISRDGVAWLLQGHDLNEFAIAVRKNHSSLISNALSDEIRLHNRHVLWDIGANIGAISLPLLRKHNELMSVLFEPSAEVAGRLIRNLSINPDLLNRSLIMNIALSDIDALTRFYVSNEPFNSGTAGLGFSHNRFQFPVGVQTYAGDSLIASGKCPAPDLIKIDVEGFEIDVFKGLKGTLLKHHPPILFEHSLYRLRERGCANDEVTRFLESLGYTVFRLSDDKPIAPADLDKDADFIARAI
jgi:FkbM family methyltransferase